MPDEAARESEKCLDSASHALREAIKKCDGEEKGHLLELGIQAIVKNPLAKELEKAVTSLTADRGIRRPCVFREHNGDYEEFY